MFLLHLKRNLEYLEVCLKDNMRKSFVFLFVLLFISLVSAVPPFQTNVGTTNGYQIFYPQYEYVAQYNEFEFHIHVLNISTGERILTSEANCELHLYNTSGMYTYKGTLPEPELDEWELEVTSGNFSDLGLHSYFIHCNNTAFGGAVKGTFEVTRTGYSSTTPQMLLYSLMILVLMSLLVLCLIGGSRIQFKNVRNRDDEVIQINWRKYLKIFCWTSAYMLTIAIVFIIWNLLYAYADWYNITLFFRYLYQLLMVFALPVLIGSIIMAIINYISDKKIKKFIDKMGLPYKEV